MVRSPSPSSDADSDAAPASTKDKKQGVSKPSRSCKSTKGHDADEDDSSNDDGDKDYIPGDHLGEEDLESDSDAVEPDFPHGQRLLDGSEAANTPPKGDIDEIIDGFDGEDSGAGTSNEDGEDPLKIADVPETKELDSDDSEKDLFIDEDGNNEQAEEFTTEQDQEVTTEQEVTNKEEEVTNEQPFDVDVGKGTDADASLLDEDKNKKKVEKFLIDSILKTDLQELAASHPDDQRRFLAEAACITVRSVPLLRKTHEAQKLYSSQRTCDRDLIMELLKGQQDMKGKLDMLLHRIITTKTSGEGEGGVEPVVTIAEPLPCTPVASYDDLKKLFQCPVSCAQYYYFL